MGGVKKKPKKGEGKVRDMFVFTPSALHVDHGRNTSRAALYSVPEELTQYVGRKSGGLLSEKFCYTLTEVEGRLTELKADGQITPASAYLTATNDAYLTDGYLRHAAMLLAEARDELGQVPRSNGTLLCTPVTQPKSPADWLSLASRNFAENNARKELTAVDRATYISRLCAPAGEGGFGLTREQASDKVGISKRAADRYLSLLALPPDTIMRVHTGELAMSKALKSATTKGEGTSKGPRLGISTATARKRLALPKTLPSSLSPRELLLMRLIAGDPIGDDEKVPADIAQAIDLLQTPPPKEDKPSKPRKKAPRKMSAPEQ